MSANKESSSLEVLLSKDVTKDSLREHLLQPACLELFKQTDTPESLRSWAKALRSGESRQAHGCLKCDIDSEVSYCCLGVRAVLQNLNFETPDVGVFGALVWYSVSGSEESGLLPPSNLNTHIQDILAYANDGGFSFEEIASLLEAVAEALCS